ncbi:MAG: transcription repressor NadR [Oscillospiraceae bacterium]|nr:transcription repressor NadR [Oscillospiraceae bacterium]
MRAEERRAAILETLRRANEPVSAGALAAACRVSRQIIVGDVALLRAAGEDIAATPRGYVMQTAPAGIVRRVACRHTNAEMGDELNAIVDQGCEVLDVVVEHPLYGQLTGALRLKSRYDVGEFLRRCARAEAKPLSELTEGIHLHTLSCPSEAAFFRARAALEALGFLLDEEN